MSNRWSDQPTHAEVCSGDCASCVGKRDPKPPAASSDQYTEMTRSALESLPPDVVLAASLREIARRAQLMALGLAMGALSGKRSKEEALCALSELRDRIEKEGPL